MIGNNTYSKSHQSHLEVHGLNRRTEANHKEYERWHDSKLQMEKGTYFSVGVEHHWKKQKVYQWTSSTDVFSTFPTLLRVVNSPFLLGLWLAVSGVSMIWACSIRSQPNMVACFCWKKCVASLLKGTPAEGFWKVLETPIEIWVCFFYILFIYLIFVFIHALRTQLSFLFAGLSRDSMLHVYVSGANHSFKASEHTNLSCRCLRFY